MSIRQAKEKGDVRLFVIEAALLIEDEYKSICDELWYIWVDKETRIKRLMLQRNYTKEKSVSIMNNQSSDEFYKENCDFIIDNNVEGQFENIPVKTLRSIQSKYLEKVVVVTVFQCFEEIKRELSDKFNSVDVINIEEFLEK